MPIANWFDLAEGRKVLVDYADMRNPDDPWDRRVDLPSVLRTDLRAAKRDYYDVVCFTHLDDDHCCGVGDFFWLEHAAKYQGDGRIKIREWVPAVIKRCFSESHFGAA
jgi:ribonuclease BN (tRNA processing enzyme)